MYRLYNLVLPFLLTGLKVMAAVTFFLPSLLMIQWIEQRFFPVVIAPTIMEVIQYEAGGVAVILGYRKVRDCEFIGIAWWKGPIRLSVDYMEDVDEPRSSLMGPVVRGPWHLKNTSSLEGTRAEVWHQCHPLWAIHDPIYP